MDAMSRIETERSLFLCQKVKKQRRQITALRRESD